MDMMMLRRGLLAQMAGSGHVRMASGEFTHTSGVAYLNHNLNSNKIIVIMQRVETDHANINATNQYQSIFVFGATPEALQIDSQQTYSLNSGNQVSFDLETGNVNGASPHGINSYFPGVNGTYPINVVMGYNGRGVQAKDAKGPSLNTVQIYPGYVLVAGRWVWRAYALD